MTAFEDYVNRELPRRPALLTVALTGYDGDPNDAGAPTIIKSSPKGTQYLQETPGDKWWVKNTASERWSESGVPLFNATQEAFTLTLSLTGVDPTFPLRIVNQAQATAWGAFRTIRGSFATLPDDINHVVTALLPTGPWDTAAGATIADDLRDLGRFYSSAAPVSGALVIAGQDAWAQAGGTPTMAVTNSVSDVVTLQTPHGLPANTYKGYYLLVTAGTGAGQYKPIFSYTGSQIVVAGTFSPALTGTSVVQVAARTSTLNIAGTSDALAFGGRTSAVLGVYLGFSRLNFTPSAHYIQPQNMSLQFSGGCRLVGVRVRAFDSTIYLDDVVFDERSFERNCIFVQGGTIRSVTNSTPQLFLGPAGVTYAALRLSGVAGSGSCGLVTGLFLAGGHKFSGWGPAFIELDGADVSASIQSSSTRYPGSDQLATTAVLMKKKSTLIVTSASGLAGSTFKGALRDYDLDGTVQDTWTNLDLAAGKVKTSTRLTAVMDSV